MTPATGLRAFCLRGLSFAGIYRRLVLLSRTLDDPIPELATALPMTVGLLEPRHMDAYARLRPDQTTAAIRRRLETGHQCFIVWHEAHIIHAAWTATGRTMIEYLARELILPPDEVYVYDAFTAPAFRGRGASPLRAAALGEHYRARGYRSALTAVHPENTTGFRPLEKVGARRVSVIGYIGIGSWRWQFSRGTAARVSGSGDATPGPSSSSSGPA